MAASPRCFVTVLVLLLVHSPSALAARDLCTGSAGTDYVGDDLSHHNISSPAACCAVCDANPECLVWKFDTTDPDRVCYLKTGKANPTPCATCVVGSRPTPPPPPPPPTVFSCGAPSAPGALASLDVYNDGSYGAWVAGESGGAWFAEGDVAIFAEGRFYSHLGGSFELASMGPERQGSDNLGAWRGWPVVFEAAGMCSVETLFVCYDSGLVAFNATFPSGLNNTGDSANRGLVTQFPSFASAGALGEELGYLLNGGIWTLFEIWGVGTNNNFAGSDGPAWFYNSSFAPSSLVGSSAPTKPATAILCALDHFKTMAVAALLDPATNSSQRVAWGVSGSVTTIPAGFATSVGFFAGAGITATTYAWGDIYTTAYSTRRIPKSRDVLNGKLSYWSDNGAVYFQSYWNDVCHRNCTPGLNDAETLFTQLKQYHVEQALPFALYQLDTWWFYQGADVGSENGGLDCVDWRPRADLFPNGLPALTQKGVPLLLYSWGWVLPGDGQRMTNWTWLPGGSGGTEAMVALDEVYAFYSMIRDRFLAFNGTSYESDNMGSWMSWPQTKSAVDGGERFWHGFAAPFCQAGVPVQICESTASDLLESLKYGCVTSSRDQIDDVPGDHQSHGPNEDFFLIRWHVGFQRMLIGALDLAPFFDNVWSQSSQPGPPWYNAFENYTELAVALSVLGGGAVGIGDEIGFSNRTLVMACVMEDGTLLSPSRPSAYIDAVYLPQAAQPFDIARGRVLQAPSFVGDLTFMTVLAIDIASPFALLPAYLEPDLSQPDHLALRWSPGFAAVDANCADGSALALCAQGFGPTQPFDLRTGLPPYNNTHFFEVVSLSPVFSSGYSVLGELGKFVRVSPARFPAVNATADGMTFVVRGAAGESVSVAVAAPSSAGGQVVRRIALAFSSGGSGLMTVVCAGSGALPCTVKQSSVGAPPGLNSYPAAGEGALSLWEGRTLISSEGAATFDWPGIRVVFEVLTSTQVWATIASPGTTRGLFRVRVDDVNVSSFFTDNSTSSYALVLGLDAMVPHTVELISILEPALQHPQPFLPAPPYQALTVASFEVDGSLVGPLAPLERRMVFVGDSITCGFGAGGSPPNCPNPAIYSEDNDRMYGRLLCAHFGASCDVVAWSGKGLYVNSPTAGTNETLPSYYKQTLGAGQTPYAATWNFGRFVPDLVVINLGTNDFGHDHDTGPAWEANFTKAYVSFMVDLTLWHNNPALPIFAASGPLTAKPTAAIEAAVADFNAQGGKASFMNLQTGLGADGCDGHPGPKGHAAMAALAATQIAQVMGWQGRA